MRVLAISAHPDDETLGCAGTLLKHRGKGDSLFWVIVTQAHEPKWSPRVIEQKVTEVCQVAKAYGMERCFKLGFPTALLDNVGHAELVEGVSNVLSEVSPEIVYLIHGGDAHTDHHIVFTATMSALKPAYMARLGVHRVLSYETLSSTEAASPLAHQSFTPNVFSDITPYIDRKIELMGLYGTEIQQDPLPRGPSAIRALARYRGSTIGVEYGEAFMLVRELM